MYTHTHTHTHIRLVRARTRTLVTKFTRMQTKALTHTLLAYRHIDRPIAKIYAITFINFYFAQLYIFKWENSRMHRPNEHILNTFRIVYAIVQPQ